MDSEEKNRNESFFNDVKKLIHVLLIVISDLILINLASFASLWIRYEFSFADLMAQRPDFIQSVLYYSPIFTILTVLVFWGFGLYSSMWKYAGIDEIVRAFFACVVSTMLQLAGMNILSLPVPRSFYLLSGILLFLLTSMFRFSYRFFRQIKNKLFKRTLKRTMVIGAGRAGSMVIREFNTSSHSQNKVVCVVDCDPIKHGQMLQGVRIVGGDDDIVEMAKKYKVEEIVLAIPSATNRKRKELLEKCQKTGCTLKTLPALFQLANGTVSIEKVRDVDIEDLLGREPVKVDMSGICQAISGKVVLVTGGGGSIGSELCRQISSFEPAMLIIFDIYENNAYNIQQELIRNYPQLNLRVLIGSVRDVNRVEQIFNKYKPQMVFHAAAHKHVPLMEESPNEVIKNNIIGTYNVACAADKYGAESMCLISTDKAVNPTNVMGASKRCCEMIVQMMDRRSQTRYVAVRFGNVLGSNGSVIPLFREQIKNGGPVTVTHKDIIRYFMTIPEAVSLVLQSGVYADGGEIFILDMGEPVKIDNLARNMIKLSGFEPEVDIEVKYTGLRPGEKLYEELLMDEEGMKKTENDLIFIGHDLAFDDEKFCEQLMSLVGIDDNDTGLVRKKLQEIVPTYHKADNSVRK